MSGLFRNEAIASRTIEWIGAIHVSGSRLARIYALAAIFLACVATAMCLTVTYTAGLDAPGVIAYSYPPASILSPVKGRLSRTLVDDGAMVSRGQTVAEIVRASDESDTSPIPVRASSDGQLVGHLPQQGSLLDAGERITQIRTAGSRLTAELPIEQRTLRFVRPGQRLSVRIGGAGEQDQAAIPGTVESVKQNAGDKTKPYTLVVTLSSESVFTGGGTYPIGLGEGVLVHVPLEKHTLAGWLLAEMNLPQQ